LAVLTINLKAKIPRRRAFWGLVGAVFGSQKCELRHTGAVFLRFSPVTYRLFCALNGTHRPAPPRESRRGRYESRMRPSFVKKQAFERQNGFSQALLDSFAKQISKMQAFFA